MATIKDAAERFFDACETGKGWAVCQSYCHPGATFSAQTGALAGVETLEAYTDWMKGGVPRSPTPSSVGRTRAPAARWLRPESRWKRITSTS